MILRGRLTETNQLVCLFFWAEARGYGNGRKLTSETNKQLLENMQQIKQGNFNFLLFGLESTNKQVLSGAGEGTTKEFWFFVVTLETSESFRRFVLNVSFLTSNLISWSLSNPIVCCAQLSFLQWDVPLQTFFLLILLLFIHNNNKQNFSRFLFLSRFSFENEKNSWELLLLFDFLLSFKFNWIHKIPHCTSGCEEKRENTTDQLKNPTWTIRQRNSVDVKEICWCE